MCKRLICKRIAETRDEAKDILGVAVRGPSLSLQPVPGFFRIRGRQYCH